MNVTHLECANCHKTHEANVLQNLCLECGKPLLVRYDLQKAAQTLTKESLKTRPQNLWRYREVLPVENPENIISFGEGFTPLLKADRLSESLPLKLNLYIKDESTNPTQSFKARGMSAAVSMAKELGVTKVAAPSAGNCGGRACCLRFAGGNRIFFVYAARHSARKHYRMRADGRERNSG
jgi:threonine synthase